MNLSDGQKHSIAALSKILSLETLLKVREGQITDFNDLQLNLFNPSSLQELTEVHSIIEKEIAERRKKLQKALQYTC